MNIKSIQNSFLSGEVSRRIRAQSRTEIVAASAKSLTNVLPENHGIAMGREGGRTLTANIDSNATHTPERVVRFQVSNGDWYLLEFSSISENDFNVQDHTSDTRNAPYNDSAGYRLLEIRVYAEGSSTPETFEKYSKMTLAGGTYSDVDSCLTLYEDGDSHDIHFLALKDELIMVHSDQPPMRLIRYVESGDIRWTFTYMGTFGAPWGNGLNGVQKSAAARILRQTANWEETPVMSYPRAVTYYQGRVMYAGMIDDPYKIIASRVDDFALFDSGIASDHTDGIYQNETGMFSSSYPGEQNYILYGHYPDLTQISVYRSAADGFGEVGDQLADPADYEAIRVRDDQTDWNAAMVAGYDIGEYPSVSSLGETFPYGWISRFQRKTPQRVLIAMVTAYNGFTTTSSARRLVTIVGTRPEDSGFIFNIASTDQDTIQWLAVGEGFFAGTTSGEWVASSNSYVSHLNPPQFKRVSAYGSQHIQPIQVGDAMVYVTASGKELRAFRSDYTANREKWQSIELSFFAEHLFEDYKIKSIAYSQTPDNTLWVLRTDGTLLAAVYDPTVSPGAGWAVIEKNNNVLSITSVSDGNQDKLVTLEDAVVFVDSVTVPLGVGVNKSSQKLINVHQSETNMDNYGYEESGSDITTIDMTDYPAYLWGCNTRYALTNADEQTICIMGDGAVDYYGLISDLTLAGDIYTMVTPARFIEVGTPFTQTVEVQDFDQGQESTLYVEKRRHEKIFLDLLGCQPPMVNGDWPSGRTTASLMGNIEPPIDGKTKAYSNGYSRARDITIEQPYPYRLLLAAIVAITNIGSGS